VSFAAQADPFADADELTMSAITISFLLLRQNMLGS
jgi:hypothetical protein